MKKIKTTLCALILSTLALAQPYGITKYSAGATLTSGRYTTIATNGFLMAGLWTGGFEVLHTDNGPLFSSSSTAIKKDYTVSGTGASCLNGFTGALGGIGTMVGVTAIELQNNLISKRYAVAGAYSRACFLAWLDNDGAISATSTTATIAFPFPYSSNVVTKPCLAQAINSDILLCGQFDTALYAIRITTAGNVVWSHFYSSGHDVVGGVVVGGTFAPRAIVESPFNGDVVITGQVIGSQSWNRGTDGFFLSLAATSGNPNTFKWIGDAVANQCNFYNAMTPALGMTGGGFVLAGMSDPSGNVGAWMTAVDQNGNVQWDGQYTSTTDNNADNFMGVVERKNTSSNYEYYGVMAASTGGIIVMKIDAAGNPNAVSYGGNDEFFYTTTGAMPSAIDMSYNQIASGDQGLHIYIADSGNPAVLETYFNGVSGCSGETLTNIGPYCSGHNDISHWIKVFGSLSTCGGLSTNWSAVSATPSQPCNGSLAGGSNARQSGATGLVVQKESVSLYIAPNPSNGDFSISAAHAMELKLVNELGQQIRSLSFNGSASEIKISGLANGVYFITGVDGNAIVKEKVIIAK